MRRRPTRPRDDAEPEFLAFLRVMPCVVCGKEAANSGTHYGNDAHHPIEGRHALALKVPDAQAITLCPYVLRGCHYDWHHYRGFCKGWSKEQRRSFEQIENERQRAVYLEFRETGVLVEPVRETA